MITINDINTILSEEFTKGDDFCNIKCESVNHDTKFHTLDIHLKGVTPRDEQELIKVLSDYLIIRYNITSVGVNTDNLSLFDDWIIKKFHDENQDKLPGAALLSWEDYERFVSFWNTQFNDEVKLRKGFTPIGLESLKFSGLCSDIVSFEYCMYLLKPGLLYSDTSGLVFTDVSKPPLGLKPKSIHDSSRKVEILEAIGRYSEAGKAIPLEWLKELKGLVV